MIEVSSESNGNTLILKAVAKLTNRDYTEIIIPRLETIISEYGKARFLIDEFKGWKTDGFLADARFGMYHRNDFEKIAVVGASTTLICILSLLKFIVSGEMRLYAQNERADALSWIKA